MAATCYGRHGLPFAQSLPGYFFTDFQEDAMKSFRPQPFAAFALLAVLALPPASAQTFKVLHTFGQGTDGQSPFTGLIQDSHGNRYGTTLYGGSGKYGTFYKLNSSGKESVIYNFCSKTNCADGSDPEGGVVEDSKGNFYGTTAFGGASEKGIVYKINSAGQETVLHSFKGGNDGWRATGSLIEDSKGNFYGTTIFGGGTANVGTVFKLDSSGKETILYRFTGGNDGGKPFAGVIEDSQGNLYGTTYVGGASGNGVIFEISSAGVESTLYTFSGGADGANPITSLILDADGNLYGTATAGGNGSGTLFEWIKATGTLKVLYTFCSVANCADGSQPSQAVVEDSHGNFYGTTYYGGSDNYGTVFELASDGTETVLHSFSDTDGAYPYEGSLLRDSNGTLYGTASQGGDLSCNPTSGCGVVFKLTP
jgi:uncharacterized repeat protein (TIGR03803 family)